MKKQEIKSYIKKKLSKLPFIISSLKILYSLPKRSSSLYLEIKYFLLNEFSKKGGTTKKMRKEQLILSITTFPKRIKRAYLPIETIMNQTIKPNKIILWLAEGEFPNGKKGLPKRLLEMEKRGLSIEFVKDNLRSHNKLIHTLKTYPKSLIITFDDDCFYPKEYIKNLLKVYQKNKNKIVGYNGTYIIFSKKGKILPYSEWINSSKKFNQYKHRLFLKSVDGILYPPLSFPKETFDFKTLKKISLFNDDVWFKAMAVLADVPQIRVFNKNKSFPQVLGTQKFGLFHKNVIGERNDKIIKDVLGKYKILPKIRFDKS